MIFGNSRGNFHVPRGEGYEEGLHRLFEAYQGKDWDHWGYSPEFENGAFCVFPYYWGECECGAEERAVEWEDARQHKPDCYQSELQSRSKALGLGYWDGEKLQPPALSSYDERNHIERQLYTDLCAEYNLPEQGCAIHCTCGLKEEYAKWYETNGHAPECGIIKPNFLYKPTGFTISWYKYPLRDSYMSEPLTVQEFAAIIDKCIESLAA